MASDELEPEMDFSKMKKKKKTTKKLVALDDDDEVTTTPAPTTTEPAAPVVNDDDDLGLVLSKTKKKKKRTKFVPEDDEDDAATVPTAEPVTMAEDLTKDLTFPLKKKRRRTEKIPEEFGQNVFDLVEEEEEEVAVPQAKENAAWAGTDRDYLYSELLERVFDIIRAKNPNMARGEKRRFVMKPPSVIKVGSRKTGFINFIEICKMMHRVPDHVLGFLLTELGTSGTLDGSNSLILKGRFLQKNMESVLRRYIREYVTCHTCKSPDTIMTKEKRLYFLTCETCGARNSVASIKEGFSAVVGKRSRMRAKEG